MADEETAAPDLDHGPNPALSAAPPAEPGYSQAEYDPDGFNPHSDGSPPAAPPKQARKAKAAKAGPEPDEDDDEPTEAEAAKAEPAKAHPAHHSAGGRAGQRQ